MMYCRCLSPPVYDCYEIGAAFTVNKLKSIKSDMKCYFSMLLMML